MLKKTTWPLITLSKKRSKIDTNPDYQRPAVWTKAQKQLLIDSILRDYDVPKIYLHERDKGIRNVKDRDLNEMYDTYRDFDPNSSEAKNIIKVLDYLDKMFPKKSPELKRYSTISLFVLIMELLPNYDIREREADIAKWFIDFESNRAEDELKEPEEQDPRLVVYHERVSHSSDTEDSLAYRHGFLKESLLDTVKNLPQKDLKRNFDEAQRQVIYRRGEGKCKECGVYCEWNNWEADHIIPWSRGGKTEIENGQILCPTCNSKKGDKMDN